MLKRILPALSICLILILLSSTLALAIGRTTTRENSTSTNEAEINATQDNSSCSDLSTRRLRIACGLSQGTFNTDNSIDESCAGHPNPKACNSLYRSSQACYLKSGFEKDNCFKRITNFKRAQAQVQAAIDKAPIRDYIVLVLYNLQEKIEYQFDQGNLTTEEATELIDQIIEIKQNVFSDRTPEEIRPMISQLKKDWRKTLADEE